MSESALGQMSDRRQITCMKGYMDKRSRESDFIYSWLIGYQETSLVYVGPFVGLQKKAIHRGVVRAPLSGAMTEYPADFVEFRFGVNAKDIILPKLFSHLANYTQTTQYGSHHK